MYGTCKCYSRATLSSVLIHVLGAIVGPVQSLSPFDAHTMRALHVTPHSILAILLILIIAASSVTSRAGGVRRPVVWNKMC